MKLLIVVDISDESSYDRHIRTTIDTLKEIGAADIPRLFVFNKADLTDHPQDRRIACDRLQSDDAQILLSAREPRDIERLCLAIQDRLHEGYRETRLLIPYDRGDLVNLLNERYEVTGRTHRPEGTVIRVLLDASGENRFRDWMTE